MAAGNVQWPKISEGFLGPQSKFEKYGLSTVSHSDPIVHMQEDQSEVEIIIAVPEDTRITIKLVSFELKKDVTEYVLIRAMGPNYCFLIRPPITGFYKFHIFALPPDEAGPQMLGVYNYLVHCPGVVGDNPFPKQYPPWKQGCYLYEPICLPKGIREEVVKFKMFIPNAKDVQVKVDKDWYPLAQTQPALFEGVASFSQGHAQGSKARVNVNFQGNNYQTLLEYSL